MWDRYAPVKMPMLKVKTVFRDRLVLMVSVDNPLAQYDKVPISMVVEQPLILPGRGLRGGLWTNCSVRIANNFMCAWNCPASE